MPGLNQKGPMGQGSMSGRKMGKCTNFGANVKSDSSTNNTSTTEKGPENNLGNGLRAGKGPGQGNGQGLGMGMGRQHRFKNSQ